ncbi:hypothetical protein LPJ70_004556 [Coemansia sp. RSA 2708]|nr:hypothetical protein LPJ70_004556 [Coemansia sp. RSA 2708]KAJ2313302.1 hypothetical protein IWW54_001598 [Coemansia sp. RSA 2705]KAJ2320775.1 hypothetical protein IWW52_001153 [Coemansia sp. RSA 2704]KAJ2738026.1 hypothetical protein H4R23_001434 [Coemansia sp. Cherry 401B]
MQSIMRLLIAGLFATLALAATYSEIKSQIFGALVEHAFGPATAGQATSYYKTRFFTAQLQSRMRYIVSQYDEDNIDKALTQSDADQLNAVVREMWRAAHKLERSAGCLSYDLTLCNGDSAKGQKLSDDERKAMEEWEQTLGGSFSAKQLSKDEAQKIHELVKDIQRVLLAHAI